jgi:hypothetical protein
MERRTSDGWCGDGLHRDYLQREVSSERTPGPAGAVVGGSGSGWRVQTWSALTPSSWPNRYISF